MNRAPLKLLVAAVLAGGGLLLAAPAAQAGPLVPIHGTVLGAGRGYAVIRNDPVPAMLPAGTRRYGLDGRTRLIAGETVDALLEPARRRLIDVRAATRFVAGLPDASVKQTLTAGQAAPTGALVDQAGKLVRLADFRGRVVLLSFVFTRCSVADLCPAISGKFAYAQHHLDPKRYHIVEITIDPRFDSPAILARYANRFAVDRSRWSLLTGEPSVVGRMLDAFGISSVRDAADDFIHNDRLIFIDKTGIIADIVDNAAWDPNDALAVAARIDGRASNPFRRLELASVAALVNFCGGSVSGGNVAIVSSLFVILTLGGCGLLLHLGRAQGLFRRDDPRDP